MSPTPARRRIAPSGDQFEITFGDQQAVVVEVGGGLRTYSADGHDVLDGYGPDERCPSGRGQLLVPWPNRIQDGQYEFEGTSHQLPLTEPELGNAIHGLVRWAAWDVAEREAERVRMEHVSTPSPATRSRSRSASSTRSRRAASRSARRRRTSAPTLPVRVRGASLPHAGDGTIDSLVLRAPGAPRARSRRAGSARGSEPVEGTRVRLPRARPIGDTKLDNAFTDLERDADGRARVSLADPATGRALTLWVDEHYPYLMLFTGDPLPDVNRRALAVEPMTCPPNAFRTGDSVIRLAPGESAAGAWGIAAH